MTWFTTSLTTDEYEEQVHLETGEYRWRRRHAPAPYPERLRFVGWLPGTAPFDKLPKGPNA